MDSHCRVRFHRSIPVPVPQLLSLLTTKKYSSPDFTMTLKVNSYYKGSLINTKMGCRCLGEVRSSFARQSSVLMIAGAAS